VRLAETESCSKIVETCVATVLRRPDRQAPSPRNVLVCSLRTEREQARTEPRRSGIGGHREGKGEHQEVTDAGKNGQLCRKPGQCHPQKPWRDCDRPRGEVIKQRRLARVGAPATHCRVYQERNDRNNVREAKKGHAPIARLAVKAWSKCWRGTSGKPCGPSQHP